MSTLLVCPVAISWLNRRRVLDVPGARSSHVLPTPRGGGVAPALGATVGILVAANIERPLVGILVAALGCGAIGLVEDFVGVGPIARLTAQAVTAAAVVAILLGDQPHSRVWVAGVLLAWLWLVAFTNAFNFMDGINGISASQVIVAGAYWGVVGAWLGEPTVRHAGPVAAAAALAFLPFNYPRARVFLGDIGSYYFGAWLAAVVVIGTAAGLRVETVGAPLLVYLADSGWTLVRRTLRGGSPFEPHREHVYQRLVQQGRSHATVTAIVAVFLVACCGFGALTGTGGPVRRISADLGLALVALLYLACPTLLDRARASSGAPQQVL